ncbi:MAG: outer membrane lipid asymmetry maintenance protein MlaD [bacterium]
MSQRGIEISVGVFVLVGLLALSYITIRLGGLDLFTTGTYDVSARFTSVSGLWTGAPVEMSGVRIGKVHSISLDDEDAVVVLRFQSSVKITKDAIASIRTKGILGDKYITISQGGSDKRIPPGGRIRETEPPIDIEKLIGDFIFEKVK